MKAKDQKADVKNPTNPAEKSEKDNTASKSNSNESGKKFGFGKNKK